MDENKGTRLLIDIETVGRPWEEFDPPTQDYLLYRLGPKQELSPEERLRAVKKELGLFPTTCRIVTIGLLNPATGGHRLLLENTKECSLASSQLNCTLHSEEEMLENFWEIVHKFCQLVTFNGRQFDLPVLQARSAMLDVKPSRTLNFNRYHYWKHLDLLDALTNFGASHFFTLDHYCRSFNIPSPKEAITGTSVAQLYQAGRMLDIAEYCYGDLQAEAELLKLVDRYYLVPAVSPPSTFR